MKAKRTRLLDRRLQNRDARLFVVATEGERTEPDYFEDLQARALVDRLRVKVVVAPPIEGRSAPEYVLGRLDEIARTYQLETFDELWLVSDVDHHLPAKLALICTMAGHKGYFVAISNPSFEVWLILHRAELADRVTAGSSAQDAKRAWSTLNAGLPPFERSDVEAAVRRARALEGGAVDGWPQRVGSHVYRLVERILVPSG